MTTKKSDMVLDWVFDIPNQTLSCKIGENLEYIALEGGTKGYTKLYRKSDAHSWTETHITNDQWSIEEKIWISETYGFLVGKFTEYLDLEVTHPETNTTDNAKWGISEDGRALDHLQRLQIIMEGYDCATIGWGEGGILFVTPDNGKTIYKRESYTDVSETLQNASTQESWLMHPQPCTMHPRTVGVKLSSYEEMRDSGVDESIVSKCENLEWDSPLHPELQKFYVYPK
jgi:hypothetical protein